MGDRAFKGDSTPLEELSGFETFLTRLINALAFGMGYAVGFLRYRLFTKLSLFGVLSHMSRGLEAATPPEVKNAS